MTRKRDEWWVLDPDAPAPDEWAIAPSEIGPGERGRSALKPFLRMPYNRYVVQRRVGKMWARATLRESGGRLVPIHFEMWPAGREWPRGGISASDLRKISFPAAARAAMERETGMRKAGVGRLTQTARERMQTFGPKRPGRARTADEYAELARLYHAAYDRDPRRPIAELSRWYRERLGWRVERDQVREWARAARRAGWLPKPGQGIGGGQPTAKLLEWIERQGGKPRRGKER